MMIGFIVWTRTFVEFGDKTNDVITKQQTLKNKLFCCLFYRPPPNISKL